MRLKNGMAASRITISMGAAVHSRPESGSRNSKRSSQAQTREHRIRPACITSTTTDWQRKSAENCLLVFVIAQLGHFLSYEHSSRTIVMKSSYGHLFWLIGTGWPILEVNARFMAVEKDGRTERQAE